MADMDPEMAFLEAQSKEQEYDPAADYSHFANQPEDDDDDDEEEEYDPASALDEAVHSTSAQSASMPVSVVNTPPPATDGALKPPPTAVDADAAAPTPSKQVRTKGGFVDDSEDDEAEEPVAVSKASVALLNAPGAPESPQRSVTLSPNNTLAQQNMPSSSAQDQAVPAVSSSVTVPQISSAPSVPNGGTPVPDATKTAPPSLLKVASARQSAAPATPVSASLPKPRLPQDRVGLLEDRIADDPRGDIEAWLGLIDEHRRRHKHDDARAVYERFFQVFPSAVSMSEYT
jgi:cleavage stimulation factor subunit 3